MCREIAWERKGIENYTKKTSWGPVALLPPCSSPPLLPLTYLNIAYVAHSFLSLQQLILLPAPSLAYITKKY